MHEQRIPLAVVHSIESGQKARAHQAGWPDGGAPASSTGGGLSGLAAGAAAGGVADTGSGTGTAVAGSAARDRRALRRRAGASGLPGAAATPRAAGFARLIRRRRRNAAATARRAARAFWARRCEAAARPPVLRRPGAPSPAGFAPGLLFSARRARFHALRVAAACLRARLASRLASLTRLRARLSSSLAMRTRCLATSACSLARSRGSAGVCCSPPVFFICGPRSEKERSLTQRVDGFHHRELSTEFVHNHVDRGGRGEQTLNGGKGLRHAARVFAIGVWVRERTNRRRPLRTSSR